jgi:hypothetical protein
MTNCASRDALPWNAVALVPFDGVTLVARRRIGRPSLAAR